MELAFVQEVPKEPLIIYFKGKIQFNTFYMHDCDIWPVL